MHVHDTMYQKFRAFYFHSIIIICLFVFLFLAMALSVYFQSLSLTLPLVSFVPFLVLTPFNKL